MEVRRDFSHNSKPGGLGDPIHFCFIFVLFAIDLSQNSVAIIYRKKSVWGH